MLESYLLQFFSTMVKLYQHLLQKMRDLMFLIRGGKSKKRRLGQKIRTYTWLLKGAYHYRRPLYSLGSTVKKMINIIKGRKPPRNRLEWFAQEIRSLGSLMSHVYRRRKMIYRAGSALKKFVDFLKTIKKTIRRLLKQSEHRDQDALM